MQMRTYVLFLVMLLVISGTAFSQVDSIESIAPDETIQLEPPFDGSIQRAGTEVTFLWSEAENAIRYRLQVASDMDFEDILLDEYAEDVQFSWDASEVAETHYYYRFASVDSSGTESEWSPNRRFRHDDGHLRIWERFIGILGIFALLGIAILMSRDRKAINWRTVMVGVGLQVLFAIIVLKTYPGQLFFEGARTLVVNILHFSDYGARFIFGDLYLSSAGIAEGLTDDIAPGGLTEGFSVWDNAHQRYVELGGVFAFHVLPTIIFFASIMAVLYHIGVMQRLVQGLAWIMTRAMGTSGSESLSAASNIFVGQTEAPFVVKPFIGKMTLSEIMAVMTGGFATVAGGVLAAYVRFGVDPGHLLAASVMSAPAALVFAKIIIPETEVSNTGKSVKLKLEKTSSNIIDAAAAGASDGLKLAVNVAAMLIAFIAIIAMLNGLLGWFGGLFGLENLSLKTILGYLFSPLAFLMGVDFKDIIDVGYLLGVKISLNEFYAYVDLVGLQNQISQRSFIIGTYALCGFANFSSIAIQIGGISALVPERRKDLAKLGLRAMIAGALASWQTAAIAGILV